MLYPLPYKPMHMSVHSRKVMAIQSKLDDAKTTLTDTQYKELTEDLNELCKALSLGRDIYSRVSIGVHTDTNYMLTTDEPYIITTRSQFDDVINVIRNYYFKEEGGLFAVWIKTRSDMDTEALLKRDYEYWPQLYREISLIIFGNL